jgi:alpha-1,2-mannosyltransferase
MGLFAVWLGAVLALGGVSLGRTISLLSGGAVPVDFATFYLAGRMALTDPTRLHDAQALVDLEARTAANPAAAVYAVGDWAPPYAYPPFFAAVLTPLARLPFETAATIWRAGVVLCLVGCIPLLGQLARVESGQGVPAWRTWGLGVLALLFFNPAHETLLLGQIGALILVLSSAGLVCMQKRTFTWDTAGGILLGLATAVKVFPGVFLLYALARRRWGAVAGGAAAFVGCFLLGGVTLGGTGGVWLMSWNYYASGLFHTYAERINSMVAGNQAITAWFINQLGETRLASSLGLGMVLAIGLATCVIAFLGRKSQNQRDWLLEVSLVALLPILIPSIICAHSYVLALFSLAVLIRYAGGNGLGNGRWNGAAAGAGTAYLFIDISSYADWTRQPVFTLIPIGLVAC